MSRHARIEEVEDDPDDFDISDYDPRNHLPPSTGPSNRSTGLQGTKTQFITESESSQFKAFQIIYPVYFDITRTREQGRRVSREYAVKNPLAREIVDCCNLNGFQTVFEPTKTHPKDWANPGRVRILLKESGQAKHAKINNKRQLLQIIGTYLKAHPATETTPLQLRFPGVPHPDKPPPAVAIPRGWKMGKILPMHSAAVSGGGVSDNILKDMMQEMGGAGGLPGGMAGLQNLQNMFGGGGMPPAEGSSSGSGGQNKKKDKKGKK